MIDERTQMMIDGYLPNPPDPELGFNEFYWLQYTMDGKSRVLKVQAMDVFPLKDGTEYGIYRLKGNHLVRIDAGYGDPYRGVRKHDLYDNKQDCRNQTHMCCDDWEHLREIQRKEGLL